MSIIDGILSLLAPYECLGCKTEGGLLCKVCVSMLPGSPELCYRCQAPSRAGLTCPECEAPLYSVQVAAPYDGIAKDMVAGLKFSGARAVSRVMAERLAALVGRMDDSAQLLVVPVPTAASRARARGFDQAKLLARELSRRSRLPYLDCLARSGNTRQLGMTRRRRLSQLDGAFRVRDPRKVHAGRILLVDDVMTTGATLETAAHVLRDAGAGPVSAMVFARA